jgi:hypothetical protein
MSTHPLHATLDDGMLDANELGESCLEDHGVLYRGGERKGEV